MRWRVSVESISLSETPIAVEHQQRLNDFLSKNRTGHFGTRLRFQLITATAKDHDALKELGTYGFIKNAPGSLSVLSLTHPATWRIMGIAMCHFEMTGRNIGLGGTWRFDEPQAVALPELTEYVASWVETA
ncbi:MAG: hypothetical protein ACKVE4_10595 [Dissulfuribacterales bacterium]